MGDEWQDNKPMNERQFRAAVMRLGLTVSEAQRFLGISQRTVWRYVAGEAEIPLATAMLLRLMVDRKIPVVGTRR